MKISDLLRSIADSIDAEQPAPTEQVIVQPEPYVEPEPECTSSTPVEQPKKLFVPPLQLKIELMKKAADVKSIYDKTPTDMRRLRKNAGLAPLLGDVDDFPED